MSYVHAIFKTTRPKRHLASGANQVTIPATGGTSVQRRLAAILAADVVGYSKLMGEDEAGTLAALRQLRRELLAPAVTEFRGNLIKSMGDGWLVEFPSAVDAVTCAIKVQESLTDQDLIKLRIGLHIGDVTFEDEDIYGDGVNIAARLQEIASPGAIVISDNARRSIDGKLAAAFQELGLQELKNIADPVIAYAWVAANKETSENKTALPLPDKPSIAVLPFDNMSGNAELDYLADGISEDITTEISRYSQLFVIARNTAFTYKGQNVSVLDIAQELNVHFVLEGSVRKAGNQLRINAQLIDGRNGNHLWAERYDGSVDEIFKLQDEVTRKIVSAAEPHIGFTVAARIERGEKLFDDAEDLAWRGSIEVIGALRQSEPDKLEQAVALAEEAIKLNERCLRAYNVCAYQKPKTRYECDILGFFVCRSEGASVTDLGSWRFRCSDDVLELGVCGAGGRTDAVDRYRCICLNQNDLFQAASRL
jgi:TolB-like protein